MTVKKGSPADASYIVFVDEAGFMLGPTVRRTWAPKGHTPILKITRPHDRISVIGAITIRRGDWRLAFHYKLSADNTNFRGLTVAVFIEELRRKLKGQMTVVWDEISIHWGSAMRRYIAGHPSVELVAFPPYAPELNPVDLVWGYVKYNRLANFCPYTLDDLRSAINQEFIRLKRHRNLLKSFVSHVGLKLD